MLSRSRKVGFFVGSSRLGDNLLGGLSPLIWVISIVTLLITLLVTTHEPPSRVLCLLRGCESSRLVGSQDRRIPVGTWKPSNKKQSSLKFTSSKALKALKPRCKWTMKIFSLSARSGLSMALNSRNSDSLSQLAQAGWGVCE